MIGNWFSAFASAQYDEVVERNFNLGGAVEFCTQFHKLGDIRAHIEIEAGYLAFGLQHFCAMAFCIRLAMTFWPSV